MSLEVVNLTKIYGKQKAVDQISFKVNSGEIVGFLGPNGAGKSTTMKILTGYITPNSGDAKVMGLEVVKEPLKVKQRVGYLPEHNPMYLEMYVKEYLSFIGKVHGLSNIKQKVSKIILAVGLEKEQHKKIDQLSKGYRQRVGLAQALIHDPDVIILDEPTSGLDPNQVLSIRALIKEVGKNKTVLLSSHIMQEVEAMCDRVIIINQGKIIADGPTQELKTKWSKKKSLTVQFKNPVEIDVLKKALKIKEIEALENHAYTITTDREDIQEAIFKFAVDTQNIILKQQEEEIKLEEIFQFLTNG